MMVMTAKVDKKKIAMGLAAVVVIIAALLMLMGGDETAPTAATSMANNEARVKFLTDLGWDVAVTPTESTQVRIPTKSSEVFDRYNELQKSQGYDLSEYGGKTVMRYVYKIKNYPGAVEPVYATLLVYKGEIIGGDVTDTAAKGVIQGFQMPKTDVTAPTTPETQPTQAVE